MLHQGKSWILRICTADSSSQSSGNGERIPDKDKDMKDKELTQVKNQQNQECYTQRWVYRKTECERGCCQIKDLHQRCRLFHVFKSSTMLFPVLGKPGMPPYLQLNHLYSLKNLWLCILSCLTKADAATCFFVPSLKSVFPLFQLYQCFSSVLDGISQRTENMKIMLLLDRQFLSIISIIFQLSFEQ